MKRVTGLGGMFFKSEDPKKLMTWYQDHLGVEAASDYNGHTFEWQERGEKGGNGSTVFSPFAADTKYFQPGDQTYMFNFRVADLHALLTALREEGVQVLDQVEESEFGKFGWIIDPEGRKIELWQPPENG